MLPQEHFIYHGTINYADAAAIGASAAQNVQIGTDSDFFCTKLEVFTRVDDTGRGMEFGDDQASAADGQGGWPDPACLIQVTDQGSDRTWHNEPVDGAVYRPGNRGFAKPRLVRFGTQLVVTITLLKSNAAGEGYDIRFCFSGWKDYNKLSAQG